MRSEAAKAATTESFMGTNTADSGSLPSRRNVASEAVVWAPLTICRSVASVRTRVLPGPATVVTDEAVAAIPLLKAKKCEGSLASVEAMPLLIEPLRPRNVLTFPSSSLLPWRR